ncbi:hypothetical protein O9649_02655 [Achromobacter dolens]|uniref:hypothetical protein n=1 Tax=Achromobacter dolens TaxID=1287738 RepID=UPI0022B88398|nr:hypothetical protein [Achromobacter dolens]MCZ8406679.1 hypothetical protein [Achromobacter dolens]
MKIVDIVSALLPHGTDGRSFRKDADGIYHPSNINAELCPIWPPDIFAVIGTLIERSGCYTEAGPDRTNPKTHNDYLNKIEKVANKWTSSAEFLFFPPTELQDLWNYIVIQNGHTEVSQVMDHPELVRSLLLLFAVADEVCAGMGWDGRKKNNLFTDLALASFVTDASISESVPLLPYRPNSLCALVPPEMVVVMPKTLTATVGCTIRSLSHNLALLPPITQCSPSWALTSEEQNEDEYKNIQLLVVPYPFFVPSNSFTVTDEPVHLKDGTFTAAYFGLKQNWLKTNDGREITSHDIFENLINPLILEAKLESKSQITGIIMPECALSKEIADSLAALIGQTGVSFFTTGILSTNPLNGKTRNSAKTYILHRNKSMFSLEQFKHHRWRLDRRQCEQYGLDFHRLSRADKWWEDIDVSNRQLPFLALRQHMSMTVLICEDLARNDPAMSVVRAVGPNLVIALLMDGPQLAQRWPGKYATVLGEDPGSGVLSVTCAAMLDRSNNNYDGTTQRSVGLWRSDGSSGVEINLPQNYHGVLLNIHSCFVEQHTLDTRPDAFGSRKLSLHRQTPLRLAATPQWLC